MNKDFKNDLIKKIKRENIKPISKSFFVAKNIFIYLFLIISVFIWAISLAITFWYLFEADWILSNRLWLMYIAINFLPVFWVLFLIISIALSYFNFKNTSRWYKFYIWQIILVNIIFSIIFWAIFYITWFSQIIEDKIQNNLHNYREYIVWDKILRMKKIWQNEEKWLLLWKIITSIPTKEGVTVIKLKDTNNKIWEINISEKTNIRHNLELKPGLKIKLVWEKKFENIFEVSEIRPFIWNWKWYKNNHK